MKVALQLAVLSSATILTFCLTDNKYFAGILYALVKSVLLYAYFTISCAVSTKGCCPVIDKAHSLIQGFGYQCSAAITVSAGTCSEKGNFM